MCAQLLIVVYKDGEGRRKRLQAILDDISPNGACLHVEDSIPADTAISILYPNGRYCGHVRYCVSQPSGYLVGIQFDPGYRWSRRHFKPEHLLQFSLTSESKD